MKMQDLPSDTGLNANRHGEAEYDGTGAVNPSKVRNSCPGLLPVATRDEQVFSRGRQTRNEPAEEQGRYDSAGELRGNK